MSPTATVRDVAGTKATVDGSKEFCGGDADARLQEFCGGDVDASSVVAASKADRRASSTLIVARR